MNRNAHIGLGAATGLMLPAVAYRGKSQEVTLGDIALCTLWSAVGAILPDALESADSPNHRAFCHSKVCGALLALAGRHAAGRASGGDYFAMVMTAIAAGYLSHLVADGFTPRGLPLC